jgi:hypothetical protein
MNDRSILEKEQFAAAIVMVVTNDGKLFGRDILKSLIADVCIGQNIIRGEGKSAWLHTVVNNLLE